ncbi:MAG: hypothetical protein K2L09_02510, partial [Alistipes sp.]|nr:hypothetical protein [Alistipes sp.]
PTRRPKPATLYLAKIITNFLRATKNNIFQPFYNTFGQRPAPHSAPGALSIKKTACRCWTQRTGKPKERKGVANGSTPFAENRKRLAAVLPALPGEEAQKSPSVPTLVKAPDV